MATTSNTPTIEQAGLPGSYLGEYYMCIRLAPYSRPAPFKPTEFNVNTIINLPLPSELRDDTAVNYSNIDLNTVGDVINGDLGGVGAAALRVSGFLLSEGAAAAGGIGGAAVGAALGGMAKSAAFGQAAAGVTEDVVKSLFPANEITAAIQQNAGMAPNPNPSVMFTGPQLREFTFSWTLFARSPEESSKIRFLINSLKKRALPENSVTGSSAILKYPYMCQLNFYPWDSASNGQGSNEWGWTDRSIIRIKKCVMSSVNANYNPSNVPAFFHGTKEPVATQLTINFKEIEYMLSGDISGTTTNDYKTRGIVDTGMNVLGAVLNPFGTISNEIMKAIL